MGNARMVSAVVGIAVLSAAGGYGVGELTQPKTIQSIDTGPIAAISTTPGPSPSSPTPTTTRTPLPNDKPGLDPAGIRFDAQTFTVVSLPGSGPAVTAEITGDVPRHWMKVELTSNPNWGKFNSSYSKRSMRYGLPIADTIEASKESKIASLGTVVDQLLKYQPEAPTGTTTGDDKAKRTYTSIAYTYLPPGDDQVLLYVITRWVSFRADGKADIEISVVGLPQDLPALERIMDRAVKSATRQDQ